MPRPRPAPLHVGQATGIEGVRLVRHHRIADDRGLFSTLYRDRNLAELMGEEPSEWQYNINRSHRGVVRGIHVTRTPPGQTKLATCLNGEVQQVVADLRVGSPTFAAVETFRMTGDDVGSVLCPPGVGHAVMALSDDVVIGYLVSRHYDARHELVINPLDPTLRVPWLFEPRPLSSKDGSAPTLVEAFRAGFLPHYRLSASERW